MAEKLRQAVATTTYTLQIALRGRAGRTPTIIFDSSKYISSIPSFFADALTKSPGKRIPTGRRRDILGYWGMGTKNILAVMPSSWSEDCRHISLTVCRTFPAAVSFQNQELNVLLSGTWAPGREDAASK